jgi:hypothetical protein
MPWSKRGARKGFGHALVIREYSQKAVTRRSTLVTISIYRF